ncbi:YkzE protein [Bacillus tequilensis]|nr:YkzE protein [Bacillus tequilensis]
MVKKNRHSRDMQNHKKPMNKEVLEEEFSSEFGDYNAGKIIETLEVTKPDKNKEKKQK